MLLIRSPADSNDKNIDLVFFGVKEMKIQTGPLIGIEVQSISAAENVIEYQIFSSDSELKISAAGMRTDENSKDLFEAGF